MGSDFFVLGLLELTVMRTRYSSRLSRPRPRVDSGLGAGARFGVCVLSAGVCSGAGEDLRRARRGAASEKAAVLTVVDREATL